MAQPLLKSDFLDSDAELTDYARVKSAIAFVSENWLDQPGLDEIADHAGLSPGHFHKLFRRWAGLTPKQFLQCVTLDHARALLSEKSSLLDAAWDLGLSGSSRLYDLFVEHEAMTPGTYRSRGEGLEIFYGFHPCPFGWALVMCTDKGLAGLAFADDDAGRQGALDDMKSRWPNAVFEAAEARTARVANRIFRPENWQSGRPLKVVLIGTDFEIRVWESLLHIPLGGAVTYSDIAEKVCTKKAARAVGSAVGRNPISFVVPCHRVLRVGGGLGGYHWGLPRKQAMIGWEAGLLARGR